MTKLPPVELEFKSSSKKLQREFDMVEKKLEKIDKGAVKSSKSIDKLGGKSLAKTDKSLKGLVKSFAKFGAIAYGLSKIKDGLVSVLGSAGELEKQTIAFNSLMGSAEQAQIMLRDLNKFALKTPFEVTQVRETSKQLLAYGIAAENVIPTMKMLGDLSLGNAEKFGRLQYAYGQVRAANKLYGTELRQFTEAGIPIIDALAKHFSIAKSEVRDYISDGKVTFDDLKESMQDMTGEGGKFFGLMEEGAKTLPGIVSNIEDAWTRFKESFIDSALYDYAKLLANEVKDLAEVGLPYLGKTIEVVIMVFATLFEVAVNGFRLLYAGIATVAEKLAFTLLRFAIWGKAVGRILSDMGKVFFKVFENIGKMWQEVWENAGNAVKNTMAIVNNAIGESFTKMINKIIGGINKFVRGASGLAKAVGLKGFDDFQIGEIKFKKKALITAKKKVTGIFDGIGDVLSDPIGDAEKKLAVLEELKGESQNRFESALSATDKSVQRISNGWGKIFSTQKEITGELEKQEVLGGGGATGNKKSAKAKNEQAKAVKKIYNEYEKGIKKADNAIIKLDDQFAKHIKNIEKQVRDVVNSLSELEGNYLEDLAKSREKNLKRINEIEKDLKNKGTGGRIVNDFKQLEAKKKKYQELIVEIKRLRELEKQGINTLAGKYQKEADTLDRKIKGGEYTLETQIEQLKKAKNLTSEQETQIELLKEMALLQKEVADATPELQGDRAKGIVNKVQGDNEQTDSALRKEKYEEEKAVLEEKKMILEALKKDEILDIETIKDFKNQEFLREELAKKEARDKERDDVETHRKKIEKTFFDSISKIENFELKSIATRSNAYNKLIENIRRAMAELTRFNAYADRIDSQNKARANSKSPVRQLATPSGILAKYHDGGIIEAGKRMNNNLGAVAGEVPIMAQQGEMMIRKSVAQNNLGFLQKLNAGIPLQNLVTKTTNNSPATNHQISVDKIENIFPHSNGDAEEIMSLLRAEELARFSNLGY